MHDPYDPLKEQTHLFPCDGCRIAKLQFSTIGQVDSVFVYLSRNTCWGFKLRYKRESLGFGLCALQSALESQ